MIESSGQQVPSTDGGLPHPDLKRLTMQELTIDKCFVLNTERNGQTRNLAAWELQVTTAAIRAWLFPQQTDARDHVAV